MPIPRKNLRIWKHSHGTNKTTPDWKNEDRERFKADHVLKIFANTKRGQIPNFEGMRPGDYFFLCHGNDIQLLGMVSTDILNPRGDPLQRKYTVVRRLEGGPWKFRGHRKGWSPGGNTTCWPVPKEEHVAFQNDILRPFFGMTLHNLRSWQKATQGQGNPEILELPPVPGAPRSFMSVGQSSKHRPRGRRTVWILDPDKTGRRKYMHDELLKRFSKLLGEGDHCKCHDYDLAVITSGKILLVEAKTLRGDADHQLRLALGQILYYHHRYEDNHFSHHKVFRSVLTDAVPPGHMIELLEKYDVGAVWLENGGLGHSKLGGRFLKMFGVILESRL